MNEVLPRYTELKISSTSLLDNDGVTKLGSTKAEVKDAFVYDNEQPDGIPLLVYDNENLEFKCKGCITINQNKCITNTEMKAITDTENITGSKTINADSFTLNTTNSVEIKASQIQLTADTLVSNSAATKEYVDNYAQGVVVYENCLTRSDEQDIFLDNVIYSNGVSGVGATLTATDTIAITSIGGMSIGTNNRVLIDYYTGDAAHYNGIYTVTDVGENGVSPWILTRATDLDGDPEHEIKVGSYTTVTNGRSASTGHIIATRQSLLSNPPVISLVNGQEEPIIWTMFHGASVTLGDTLSSIQANITYPPADNTFIVSSGSDWKTQTATEVKNTLGIGQQLPSEPADDSFLIGNNSVWTTSTIENIGQLLSPHILSPSLNLQIASIILTKTVEQLRLAYDADNYSSFRTASNGDLFITNTGSNVNVVDSSFVIQSTQGSFGFRLNENDFERCGVIWVASENEMRFFTVGGHMAYNLPPGEGVSYGKVGNSNALVDIRSTTEQLRLEYDNIRHTRFTVNSSGNLTIQPSGSNTSIVGNLTTTGTLGGLSSTELSQLQNINANTISETQWSYLSGLTENPQTAIDTLQANAFTFGEWQSITNYTQYFINQDDANFHNARFRFFGPNMVQMDGLFRRSSGADPIIVADGDVFTLPEAYRPAKGSIFTITARAYAAPKPVSCSLLILPDGTVFIHHGEPGSVGTWYSLAGVIYSLV